MLLKRFHFVSVVPVLLLAVVAFGTNLSNRLPQIPNPWFDNQGGPDAYGYTWIDSDEPGGPPVQWIDISGVGTRVDGLGDDNYVGPFNLGFDFNYYWYSFDQVYIGSNGYIKVPPAYNIASPFPGLIPLTAVPNDYIAAYCGDLDFTAGGSAYYWTNDVDTFIVSWLGVPAWNTPGSTFTFQIFLNGADNTIHMNYGVDEGNLGSTNDIIIGIENNNGQVGLEHSHDILIPHDNYTVVYHRPDTTTYQVHDLAISSVMNTLSQAIFVFDDSSYTPIAWTKNVGNQVEAGAQFRCTIVDTAGLNYYNQTTTIGTINPGEEVQVTFPALFTPPNIGQYRMTVRLTMPGDMNPNNNQLEGEIDVIVIPGELFHDIGYTTWGSSWQGTSGGWSQYYVPPSYPAGISMIRFYMSVINTPPQTVIAQILDDNGMSNGPGTVLFTDTLQVDSSSRWYSVNVTGVTITEGAFYAGWQQTANGVTYLGIDSIPPASRSCWELTGTWAPYRDMETEDAMIRVMIGQGTIPEPMIAVSEDTLNYGIVFVGDTLIQELRVYNIGTAGNLILNSYLLQGVPPNVIYNVVGFTNGMEIAPGDSINLYIGFHPLVPTTFNANFNISNNSNNFPTMTVFLTGTGLINAVGDNWSSPTVYRLENCHPNPFNAETTIRFSLEKEGLTTLRVYNLAGEMVAELVNGELEAGAHSFAFNASSLSTGIYFYNLESGDFKAVKKMILMK